MKKEEEQNQVAFVEWFRYQFPAWHYLLTIGSFGENVGARRMARLKQMGLTPGYPDLVLYYPKYYHSEDMPNEAVYIPGLFIEMKTTTGRLSVEQIQIHHILRMQNYKVEIARSWEEAKKIMNDYITG